MVTALKGGSPLKEGSGGLGSGGGGPGDAGGGVEGAKKAEMDR